MTEAAVQHLRQRLSEAEFHWLPEITGLKYTSKEYGNWRDCCGTFDHRQRYANRFGVLLNTALYMDDLFGFDFDVDDADDMAVVWSEMVTMLGPPRCVRYRTNSPRRAALYRASDSDGVYRHLHGDDGGIEVMTGAQCKLSSFGIHKDKVTQVQTPILWDAVPGNVHKSELPAITVAQREAFLSSVRELLGDNMSEHSIDPNRPRHGCSDHLRAGDLAEVCHAMSYVPNAERISWHRWNAIGMALYAATGGHDRGLVAFTLWTVRGGYKDAESACTDRWLAYGNCPPDRIGAGTVFHLAGQHGYQPKAPRRPTLADFDPEREERRRREQVSAGLRDFKSTL